jgi:glycosyltransferase involved in cell wall biosynthesis
MLISVIIPNYNHQKFLKQRLDSVLNQTYTNFEVIILDDCSTDNSRDIIESYRNHPKINTIVYNDTNSGSTFLQWRKGIDLAKGEWVWIAESDDWCETSLLSELINGARSCSNCTLSYCQSILVKDDKLLPGMTVKSDACLNGKVFVLEHMLSNNTIVNASMCIFKRSEYFTISQKFTEYKFMGDCLFWIEIALKGSVHISGKSLNYFRKHVNDVTSTAYISGLYYSEYFYLLEYMHQNYNLSKTELIELTLERFKLFLHDKKVIQPFRRTIQSSYKSRLGIKYYSERLKYFKNFQLRN